MAHQPPLSMGFPRQEYWNGLLVPPPGHLSNPGIKSTSPAAPSLAGRFFTTETPGKPFITYHIYICIFIYTYIPLYIYIYTHTIER